MTISLMIALRTVFMLVGCAMVTTLIYTIAIDDLPFREDLLTPSEKHKIGIISAVRKFRLSLSSKSSTSSRQEHTKTPSRFVVQLSSNSSSLAFNLLKV